jgi:uroporphyrin-III C-methyltransferase
MHNPSASKGTPVPPGLVSLVGAGPGDPELITVKALRRLQHADVVAYDRLVNPVLLREARADAEIIYVGKHGDDPTQTSCSQESINVLLIDRARTGQNVVRLKGGDPFVFGRGSEEALELKEAGIPFEIVPGITSAIAVPAYAGIPVTHRGLATSVTIVTGHEDPTKDRPGVDWAALAKGADTLVVLMGVGRLEAITQALEQGGRSPDTPAAVIRWGTTQEQVTVTGTLATIAQRVRDAALRAPATLVIGEVAGLREHLQWFETSPVFAPAFTSSGAAVLTETL